MFSIGQSRVECAPAGIEAGGAGAQAVEDAVDIEEQDGVRCAHLGDSWVAAARGANSLSRALGALRRHAISTEVGKFFAILIWSISFLIGWLACGTSIAQLGSASSPSDVNWLHHSLRGLGSVTGTNATHRGLLAARPSSAHLSARRPETASGSQPSRPRFSTCAGYIVE